MDRLNYKCIIITTVLALATATHAAEWISGSNAAGQYGTYGTKGTPAPGNVPGARDSSISWIDANGNLWLFGGLGYAASGGYDYLNDLWKFDGANWTWVSGSNAVDQHGIYGTKGTPAPGNVPGARAGSISWTDGSGNLWLFGGAGFDASGSGGRLNDLWKFDGANWTWVSGSDVIDQYGVYGTKGAAAPDNVPGARYGSISWIDGSGNLWLFGGYGCAASGGAGRLNDLWKFASPVSGLNADGPVDLDGLDVIVSQWLKLTMAETAMCPRWSLDSRYSLHSAQTNFFSSPISNSDRSAKTKDLWQQSQESGLGAMGGGTGLSLSAIRLR